MKPRQIIAMKKAKTDSKERNASIVRCRALGLGDATIAHIFGTTRQTIHRIAGPRMAPLQAAPRPRPDPPPVSDLPLPDRLRAWRQAHAWTQPQGAKELGVSTMTLNRWENGRQGCSFAGLIRKFLDLHDSHDKAT